jgi:nucleoside-diphosphate-sugar epimerase
MKNILITGASGCVGHYVFDELVKHPDYHLYLLVRHPQKLMYDPSLYPNVTVIKAGLENIEDQAELLKKMDYVVHLAAGWGVVNHNFEHTVNLFNQLDPGRCQKIIYFSTASILGPDNKVNDAVGKIGTPYIRGKYMFHKELPKLRLYDKTVTLYPTWVLGGDARHPYSHAMQGLRAARKWLWLLRFLSIDFAFHFIHAKDIALMVEFLIEHAVMEREFVLGNKRLSADQMIQEICDFYKLKRYFKIWLSPALIKRMAAMVGNEISPWDRYCLEQKNLTYKVANPRTFGIKPAFPTVDKILSNLEKR